MREAEPNHRSGGLILMLSVEEGNLNSLPDLSSLIVLSRVNHASEPDVACRGVDRLRVTSCRAVAAAVTRRAQVRAAFDHLAGNSDFGLAGVAASLLVTTVRVFRDAA